MKPRSWIRNLFARRPGHQPRTARRRTARLYLEGLEQRLVPAPALLTSYDGVDQRLNSVDDLAPHTPPDPSAAIGTHDTVAVVKGMTSLTDGQREQILWGNAARLLRLI